MADRLDHAVHANALGDFHHPFYRIFLRDVDGIVRAQLTSHLQPEGLDVGDNRQRSTGAVAEDVEHR